MVALDTQINETKDRLDESLQADYLGFSRAPFEILLDEASAFFRTVLPPSSPVADKTLLIYFSMPNRDIIFMI
jgi:hypothetical protein